MRRRFPAFVYVNRRAKQIAGRLVPPMRKKTSLIWLSAAAGLWLGALTLQDQGLIDAYAKPAGIQHGSEGSKGIALFRQVLERVRADYIDKPEDAKDRKSTRLNSSHMSI